MRSPSRLDRSPIGRWWWSIDHASLALIGVVVMIGYVLVLAAGPTAAARFGIEDGFHFAARQALFIGPAAAALFLASMLTPLAVRRVGAGLFVFALAMTVAALLFAPEINGAKRWLYLGPFGFQPSEYLKPGFVLVAAWMLSEGARDPKFPGAGIAMGLYALSAVLLVQQPDYGQAALLGMVWMIMFFIAGWSLVWLAGLAALAGVLMAAGYLFAPHIARRIDAFLNPESAEAYQVDKAIEAISGSGLIGRAEAGVKQSLPDAHTDFIFAVAAEEFGVILCFVVIGLFAALIVRAFLRASALKSVFAQCAVAGLSAIIGLQALINIGVNLRALPAKGMTLPFISYGGSSLVSAALTMGLLLALTRRAGAVGRRKEILP